MRFAGEMYLAICVEWANNNENVSKKRRLICSLFPVHSVRIPVIHCYSRYTFYLDIIIDFGLLFVSVTHCCMCVCHMSLRNLLSY